MAIGNTQDDRIMNRKFVLNVKIKMPKWKFCSYRGDG